MITFLFMSGAVLTILGYGELWKKGLQGKLKVAVQAEAAFLSAGEENTLRLTLENHSWLPIPWLHVSLLLPKGIQMVESDGEERQISFHTFLLPRQKVVIRKQVLCKQRGFHRLQTVEIYYGEGLGLQEIRETCYTDAAILVRPQPFSSGDLPIHLEKLTGEQSVKRWYQEDASRLQGIRPFQQTDAYRHIHWPATARQGQLMVKQFETTSEAHFLIVMNVQFFNTFLAEGSSTVTESACRLAAHLTLQLAESGATFSFQSNASWPGRGNLTVAPDRGLPQASAVLDALGSLYNRAVCPFEEVLLSLQHKLFTQATIVVFTPYWNEAIEASLLSLRTEGHHLLLIIPPGLSERLPGHIRQFPIYTFLQESKDPQETGVPA